MILYHYDRCNTLASGQKIELSNNYSAIEETVEGDIGRTLYELFPDGMSRHGHRYMSRFFSENLIDSANVDLLRQQLICMPSYQIEWNFELVRRTIFPALPSRFQSIFCLKSPDDLLSWPELKTSGEQKGQLVEIYNNDSGVFEFDSKFLKGGFSINDIGELTGSLPLDYLYAKQYWSRAKTNNPRLEVLVKLPAVVGDIIPLT